MSVKNMLLFLVTELVLCYVKGHEEKSSLAFVIDRTSSMSKEIVQVKKTTDQIFDSVIYSSTNHIDNFVLVTFDDPHAQLRADTRDRDEFKKALSEIELVKGGDCPEFSMKGIEQALDITHPNSFIYVFTDASASDYTKMEVIKSLSQKKSTQVNFLLTGVCRFASRKHFVVYDEIAEATSGYVFNITKDDVSKVISFVANSLKSKITVLSRKVFVDRFDQKPQFTIDSKISDVFICASSDSDPDITVINSAGKEVDVVKFVSTERNKIVKLKNEINGVYFIKLNSKAKTLVTVTASTSICFQHGFSTVLPTSLEETSIKPSGEITDKYFLSIKLYNSARDVLLETVDLVDANDNIIRTEHLKLQNDEQQFYVTEPFDVPNKVFRIAINGFTKSKEKITRVTTTTVEYPNPDIVDMEEKVNVSPQVTILGDSHIKLEYNDVTSIKCQVRAVPKPNITWIDNYGEFYDHEVTKLDSPKYLSILNATKADKNVTLTCKATNEEGYSEKSVTLEVNKNKFLTILEYPKDIKIEYKKSEELKCKVDAYPPAQISWYRNSKKISNNEDFEIIPDNTALRIKQMQPYLRGEYYVEISNELKTEKIVFNVFIVGAEPPVINKTIGTYFPIRGSELDIYCSIIKGKPEPVISWSYKKFKYSTEFEDIVTERDSVLHFNPTENEHNGIYRCIAKNDLAIDEFEIEVVVQYAPVITRSSSRLAKKVGEKATLPCEVSGIPRPTVDWFVNNTKIERISSKYSISRNNELSFTVSLDHGGNYSCRAINKIGKEELNIKVFPLIPPTIDPPDSSEIILRTGELLKLSCNAHGLPKPTIQWIYKSFDKRQQAVQKSENSNYEIKVQLYDAGEYVCEARNRGGGFSQMSILVYIAAAPQFAPMPNILEGVVGDLVLHVPCKTLNIPVPTITWEYRTNERAKGKTITEGMGDYVIDSFNTLILKKITKNIGGLYKCIAKNADGNASREFEIQIEDFPYPSNEDLRTISTYPQGSSTTLNCPYTSDSGERYTRWYKISQDEYQVMNCTSTKCNLNLSDMTKADSAIYTCRVSTMSGSYSTQKKIIVGFEPRFQGEVKNVLRFEENDDASLDCSTYGEPAPTIKWYYASRKVLEKSSHYNFKMTVDCIGKYECIVSNIFGTIRRTFEIQSDRVCETNITFNRNMPLFLTVQSTWILTNIVRINSDIKIECINHNISDRKRKFISPLYATCIGKTTFNTQYGIIDISALKCDSPIELVIRGTNESCIKGNSELVQVGFEMETSFLSVYDVCIDKVKNNPRFIKYAMNENAANSSPKELVHFVESSYMPFKFEDLYDCSKQVGSIFAKTGVIISEGNKCCFAKKQLVSPKDMLPGLPQLATYNYVNVIPQWSTCGTENWDEVERRIRSLAASRSTILEVWTGSSDSLKLPNQKLDTFVTINDKYDRVQRVPRYIWKLVISKPKPGDGSTEVGLAIVVMNSPNLKAEEALKQIPCKRDICNKIKWMYGSQWHNPAKGFVFCCDLKDFMTQFSYNNLFPSMKPLE